MSQSVIPRNIHEIQYKYVDVTIPANDIKVSATAAIPSGWHFLGWAVMSTTGWVGAVYPENPDTPTTNIWTSNGVSTAARRIRAFYIVYK